MIRTLVGLILGLPGLFHAALFFVGTALGHIALIYLANPISMHFGSSLLGSEGAPDDGNLYANPLFQVSVLLLAFVAIAVFLIVVFALVAGIISLFVRMARLRTTLGQVVVGYLEIALIFAGFYYLVCLIAPGAISGLAELQSWQAYQDADTQAHIFGDAALRWVDCLHYSIVTQTTLGFGDMLPTTVTTKLLTGTQALIGLFFIAVGIGQRVAK